jgi:Dyp-type peroxidase family
MSTAAADTRLATAEIQGNLAGFNKDLQRFLFLSFSDGASAKAFVAELAPEIASARDVRSFNALYKAIRKRRGHAADILKAAWTNIAFTFEGLNLLGAPDCANFPEDFRAGMSARAELIGDRDDSAPEGWVPPFTAPLVQAIHALVLLAADPVDGPQRTVLLDHITERVSQLSQQHGVSVLSQLDGSVRPGAARGHEHFGFKDGISQPGIVGLTESAKNRATSIAPGEFLIGYPDQDGQTSGGPTNPPAPQPGPPGYPGPAPAPTPGLPAWATDGSFLVFRRLRQDVAAFSQFVTDQSGALGLTGDQLGAKLVGRWKSGAPMERIHGVPQQPDGSVEDPSAAHPQIVEDERFINAFDYGDDQDGARVPRAAHIRKAYPRAEDPPGDAVADRHRILRRGVPYGPEFAPGEAPYGQVVPDTQDRGLLFLCYQASISKGFEFVQQTWANTPDFPQSGDGRDPIISQDAQPREFNLPGHETHLQMNRWVQTTGGGYFFTPSLPALQHLADT